MTPQEPSRSISLRAHGLARTFGGVVAVRELSLELRPGEIVGLLGPNGAGKTTTLRMLAGILTPHAGEVRVGETLMASAPLEAKQKLGFLSGDTKLYQRLSPREVLAYFGRLYGLPKACLDERIARLIDELEMGVFADRPCQTLSQGQRQRANIARAFVHDPPILILDEPTNALDIVSGRFVVEALRRARSEQRAILFSTHIMSEAEYLCDRVYFMHEGRVADSGTIPELVARAGTSNLTDAFLRAIGRS